MLWGKKLKILSIIIPVYYNEQSLQVLYERIIQLESNLCAIGIQLEIIFIDDASGDNSWEVLKKIKQQRPPTKIIRLIRNSGSFNAIKCALRFVTGDCFTYLSADLQDPPEFILTMVERWLNGEKYIICERTGRSDPRMKKFFAALYYKLLRVFVIPGYPKKGFDLALMDKVMLPFLLESRKNINLHLFAYSLGFKPCVLYCHREERQHGKSRWTFTKKVNLFLDSLLGFSIAPIRLISLFGILVAITGFLYGLFIVVHGMLVKSTVPGFSTVVALIVFLFGVTIIVQGVIAEYVWRIFDETNKCPKAIIDEIF